MLPPDHPRRRRRPFALLVAAAFVAAVAANGTALAQSDGGAASLLGQFGGFKLAARGAGMSLAYDSPGLISGAPSPLIQVGLPEASSNMSSGPSGYALASLAYPGPLLADLASVLGQAGYDVDIPAYPVRTQAFYPSGPTEENQSVGAGQMVSTTTETGSNALAVYGGAELPALLRVGAVTSATDTHVEQGQVVSRTRVELAGVELLAGVVRIESIVTDIVAAGNGTDAATDGATTVGGVTVLGLPATLDAAGLHLGTAPGPGPTTTTTRPPSLLDPLLDPLNLGGLADALQPVAAGLSNLLTSVLGTANAAVSDLLSLAGIQIRLLEAVETKDGSQASRLANGILITLN
ncbi:MAG: choice-of-anchor P family protein, partial [Acidimicrobiales bacterium]